ncbi:hypothetical protein I6F07_13795 [Ensifer sp. IC4062]|nr:hypothetical protein [Ensifer sp. IC4062]MCA1441266.1 hypothetical protein [Ensifer sp. IC4062]
MGSFSIYHWLIILAIFAVIIVLASKGKGSNQEHVKVNSKAELFGNVQKYAALGYQTVMDRGHIVVLTKKIPFNWLLFILLLFIPVVGWIALIILLFGNKNKVRTVTIEAPENA